ncbi:hypothetical protein M3P05_10630 [Sansalvadorimonas sp. 2012CJ34-2]|uniref:Uncharacterized protein n=1 Tax=Parendozoicomonas callyspongiae TaxID=2942213 RepID=A0ABT0PG86_9GAMM|nr:hypothetical protein [Sansalvadorimonas sp. 2012CJ34-2]MCL6270375.1 hypothetical protein [Sansalvadorimonas sp. 2012CJ34-2]
MNPIRKYLLWLFLFSAASVISQYGSAIPFPLGTWLGIDVWVPLSALSVIPLLDVSRSFVQHYAELADVEFRKSLWHMLIIPSVVAFICSLTAGLPFTIFLGALVAVNVGGYIDIRVFRWAKVLSRKPHVRMRFSNAAATISGTTAFFIIAFTDWPMLIGFPHNELAKPASALLVGGIAQATVIWTAGVIMAHIMATVISWLEKRAEKTAQSPQVSSDNLSEMD